MSEHTLDNGGVSLLDDVDMEDLSELAEALLPETAPPDSNNSRDDGDVMDDVTQSLPAEGGAANAQNDTRDDKPDTNNMSERTSAETQTTPNHHDRTAGNDEAARLRLEQFEKTFATQEVELTRFAPPPQCAQYPDQETDILEAYLDHASFTVKIWVNFDAAENVFFEGTRAEACGKLQIPQAKLDSLLRMNADEINFRNVRLDICTPFRALARIYMNIREKHGDAVFDIDGVMVDLYPPRALIPLREFLTDRVRKFNNVGIDRNLDMQDLVGIARMFRRRHEDDQEDDEWEKPCYGFGEWAGVEEPTFRRDIR